MGEDDRSLESCLDGHRRQYRWDGATSPDGVEVLFERFQVVWSTAQGTTWLTEEEIVWLDGPPHDRIVAQLQEGLAQLARSQGWKGILPAMP